MNSAYSNLINSMPGQINLSDQLLNYQSQATNDSPLLSHLYNPAYAAAQSRLLSSLHHQTSAAAPPPLTLSTSPIPSNLITGSSSSPPPPPITLQPSDSNLSNDHNNPQLPQSSSVGPAIFPPVPSDLNSPTGHQFYSTANQAFSNNNNNNNNTNNNNSINNSLYCDFNSAWRSAANIMAADHSPYMGYENTAWANSYGCIGNPSIDLNTARRKNATRESTSTLKAWLQEHIKNPYPTKGEKIMLAIITKMTLTQVSTWFANARRRLKKENKMTWSPKNRSENEDGDGGGSSVDEDTLESNRKMGKDSGINLQEDVGCVKDENRSDGISEHGDSIGKARFSSPGLNNTGVSNFNINFNDVKPKIWSLAHTATSGLFPPYDNITNNSQYLSTMPLGLPPPPPPSSSSVPSTHPFYNNNQIGGPISAPPPPPFHNHPIPPPPPHHLHQHPQHFHPFNPVSLHQHHSQHNLHPFHHQLHHSHHHNHPHSQHHNNNSNQEHNQHNLQNLQNNSNNIDSFSPNFDYPNLYSHLDHTNLFIPTPSQSASSASNNSTNNSNTITTTLSSAP